RGARAFLRVMQGRRRNRRGTRARTPRHRAAAPARAGAARPRGRGPRSPLGAAELAEVASRIARELEQVQRANCTGAHDRLLVSRPPLRLLVLRGLCHFVPQGASYTRTLPLPSKIEPTTSSLSPSLSRSRIAALRPKPSVAGPPKRDPTRPNGT